MSTKIELREIEEADLPIFFEQQLDPKAIHMAAFTSKDPSDRDAFMAHWAKIMADATITIRTIMVGDQIVGNIAQHSWFGKPEVSYWIGREFWGLGIATQALRTFLEIISVRPLFAYTAADNIGSAKVLEKCGFKLQGSKRGFANARGKEIEESIFMLDETS